MEPELFIPRRREIAAVWNVLSMEGLTHQFRGLNLSSQSSASRRTSSILAGVLVGGGQSARLRRLSVSEKRVVPFSMALTRGPSETQSGFLKCFVDSVSGSLERSALAHRNCSTWFEQGVLLGSVATLLWLRSCANSKLDGLDRLSGVALLVGRQPEQCARPESVEFLVRRARRRLLTRVPASLRTIPYRCLVPRSV